MEVKDWYMYTTWTSKLVKLNIVKETSKYVFLPNGTRISKQRSLTQFLGTTPELAKEKYMHHLQLELDKAEHQAATIKDRIERLKLFD